MSAAHETHVMSREEVLAATNKPIPKTLTTIAAVCAVIGLVVFLIGIFTGNARAWQAYHVNWLFFATISVAAVAFVAVQRITTARWSRPIVRLLEGYVAFLPIAWVLLLLDVTLGRGAIFPWAREGIHVHEKALYLAPAFFIPRTLIIFGSLVVLGVWYVYTSVRLDVGLSPEWGASWAKGLRERMRATLPRDERRAIHSTHSLQGNLAVAYCLCFGFLMVVLAWDLSQSIDIHFQSTMYGWWWYMGAWLTALSTWSLLTLWWRRYLDAYDLITENHIWDLGKLVFAFTAFWGYITFGQYLVIWYGNLGEETHYFRLRLIYPWVWPSMVVVFFLFVFPFFGLLSKAAKVYLPTFVLFTSLSVIGFYLLRYLEVYPNEYPLSTTVPFGFYEIGVTLGFLGLWGLCYIAFMNAFPRMRVTLMTSPFRDEVQVPVDPETMEPLPAHE